MFSLEDEFINLNERKNHIIENMLYMVEINPENCEILVEILKFPEICEILVKILKFPEISEI